MLKLGNFIFKLLFILTLFVSLASSHLILFLFLCLSKFEVDEKRRKVGSK
jgi:hypothetical protein